MILEIEKLGDISEADKAVVLSSLTNNAIDLQALENLLSDEGLAWRDEITGNWAGPVPAVVAVGGDLGAGVAELLRHLNKIRSVHIQSDLPEWAVKASSLLAGLVAAGVITQEQSDKVIALGGGLRHGVVSEQDVLDAIAEKEAYEAQLEADRLVASAHAVQVEKWYALFNTHIAPLMDSRETDGQVWSDAIQGLLDGWAE